MKSKELLSASLLAVSLLVLPSLPANASAKADAAPKSNSRSDNAPKSNSRSDNAPNGGSSADDESQGGGQTEISCALGSVTAGGSVFSACRGAFEGNDDQDGKGALLDLLKTGTFNSLKDWTFVGKSDSNNGAVTAPNAGTSGNWSVKDALTGPFVVSLKAGGFWSAYFFDNKTPISSGTWNTLGIASNNPALSHMTVYRANVPPVTPPPQRVPEPGTLAALGLVAVGAFGLKRKQMG